MVGGGTVNNLLIINLYYKNTGRCTNHKWQLQVVEVVWKLLLLVKYLGFFLQTVLICLPYSEEHQHLLQYLNLVGLYLIICWPGQTNAHWW